MRPQGSAGELEYRRRLAVRLLDEGLDPPEVAAALESSVRSVQRWRACAGDEGAGATALAAVRQRGARPKLTAAQAAEVVAWLARSPTAFGFATERWTAPRVAAVLTRTFGVAMNPRYLNRWLRRHGNVTPQLPQRRAAERDEAAVARWVRVDWPRIKKTPPAWGRRWGSPPRPGSC